MTGPHRRAALLLPLLLFACAPEREASAPAPRGGFAPLRYDYLPPVRLNVERLRLDEAFAPPSGPGEVGPLAPVGVAGTLFLMARDRLKAVGVGGAATFSIQTASITRAGNALNGILAVRLDVRDSDNVNRGFVEARVTGTRGMGGQDTRAALYDLLKSMMDDMNVELEYQIRRELRDWLADAPAAPVRRDPAGNTSQPKRAPAKPASSARPPAPQPEAPPSVPSTPEASPPPEPTEPATVPPTVSPLFPAPDAASPPFQAAPPQPPPAPVE